MNDNEKQHHSVQNESAESGKESAAIPEKSKDVLDCWSELYRHYDAWGRLLYVGVSLSSLGRLNDHRATCAWFKKIRMISVEHYPTRALALKAEREAIEKESPYFNRVHRKGWRDVQWSAGTGAMRAGSELAILLKKVSAKAKH